MFRFTKVHNTIVGRRCHPCWKDTYNHPWTFLAYGWNLTANWLNKYVAIWITGKSCPKRFLNSPLVQASSEGTHFKGWFFTVAAICVIPRALTVCFNKTSILSSLVFLVMVASGGEIFGPWNFFNCYGNRVGIDIRSILLTYCDWTPYFLGIKIKWFVRRLGWFNKNWIHSVPPTKSICTWVRDGHGWASHLKVQEEWKSFQNTYEHEIHMLSTTLFIN